MGDRLRLTLLGCGSSPGTPRITGDWGNCNPANPKNRRMRSAALVDRISASGAKTTVVIDTGPDFRAQMLMADVKRLDAVIYTHPHADHIHGIDDLRGYVLEQRRLIDIYADQPTMERLRAAFGYCFETPPGKFRPDYIDELHHSTKYENAPMPFSVFFNDGIAVHGTTELKRLGSPASHGCVRLDPQNAEVFFRAVADIGMERTAIIVEK